MNHLELLFDDEAGKHLGDLLPHVWRLAQDAVRPCDCLLVVTEGSDLHREAQARPMQLLGSVSLSDPTATGDVAVFLLAETDGAIPGGRGWRPFAPSNATPPQPPMSKTMTGAERRAMRDPSYERGRTVEGMQTLEREFGRFYKDVDVEKFVRELRAD